MKAASRRIIARLFELQAARLIRRHRLRVVAVAGSVGKTSTKLAIATVLRQKYPTLVHEGNYNSELGLPLSIFEQSVPTVLFNPFAWMSRLARSERQIRGRYPYQILVLELGTDHPGEIGRYLRYLKPEIGVMTAVTPEHMEFFPGGLDEVAAEELLLAAASTHFVANFDEIPASYRHKYIDSHSKHYYYGLDSKVDYGFSHTQTDLINGTTGTLSKDGHVRIVGATIALFGAHSAKAAAAAYAVGDLFGLSLDQIKAGLAELHPVSGRMNPLVGINDSTIIDDTYNALPDAVSAALRALADAPVAGRRIALLGSMNELGQDSSRYHEAVGEAAAGLDLLVTLGDQANRYLGPAAVRAGLDPTHLKATDSPYAAAAYLRQTLTSGDVLLAKGSQNGVFAEEAVAQLLADPADRAKLVRQSSAWIRTKRAQFPDAPTS